MLIVRQRENHNGRENYDAIETKFECLDRRFTKLDRNKKRRVQRSG